MDYILTSGNDVLAVGLHHGGAAQERHSNRGTPKANTRSNGRRHASTPPTRSTSHIIPSERRAENQGRQLRRSEETEFRTPLMMVVVVMVGIAESEMETESVSNRFQIAQKASNATPTQRDNNRRMIPSNDQALDTTRQASTQTHALNRAKESRRDGDGQKRISTVIDC